VVECKGWFVQHPLRILALGAFYAFAYGVLPAVGLARAVDRDPVVAAARSATLSAVVVATRRLHISVFG
jgi:hypothetical protein